MAKRLAPAGIGCLAKALTTHSRTTHAAHKSTCCAARALPVMAVPYCTKSPHPGSQCTFASLLLTQLPCTPHHLSQPRLHTHARSSHPNHAGVCSCAMITQHAATGKIMRSARGGRAMQCDGPGQALCSLCGVARLPGCQPAQASHHRPKQHAGGLPRASCTPACRTIAHPAAERMK